MKYLIATLFVILTGCGGGGDCTAPEGYVCKPVPEPECHTEGDVFKCT